MKTSFLNAPIKAVLVFSSAIFALPAIATEKPHVHGSAQLSLALEAPTKGEVSFDIPADSVWGFEHVAKSEKDKAAVEKGLKTLREGASTVIRFPAELKCVISEATAEIEKEEHPEPAEKPAAKAKTGEKSAEGEKGHHEDVSGGYKFECASPIENVKVTLGLFKLLPKLRKVSFQALGNSKQTKKDLASDSEEIILAIQ